MGSPLRRIHQHRESKQSSRFGARPESAALFGLTMLMYTSEGRSHTLIEMRDSLKRAEFTDFDVVDLRDQRFSVILAR